jgi:hypothetical protein
VAIPANFASSVAAAPLKRFGSESRALRDLYVQMWCYCANNGTDGFVPEEEISGLALPDPERVARRDVSRLVDSDLIEKAVGGFFVPDYAPANGLTAEGRRMSERKAEGARRANHERWHARRGEVDPECEFCQYTDQSTDQSTDEFSDQYSDAGTDQYSDPGSDNRDSGGDTELFNYPPVPPTGVLPPRGCDLHPDRRHGNCRGCGTSDREQAAGEPDSPEFTEFWNVYPRKVGKPRARKAWRAAMRKHHDPAQITKAAQRYRDDPSRKDEFTAHPSTWLNDERYNDEPNAPRHSKFTYPTSPWKN